MEDRAQPRLVQCLNRGWEVVLPETIQMEHFSLAYISAVVARAGYNISDLKWDDGVDLTVCDSTDSGIRFDIQAKSTYRPIFTEQELKFDLKTKNYNQFCSRVALTPIILVVVVVPEELDDWLDQTEDQLLLRHCAYWRYLTGEDPTKNKETIRVDLDRDAQFNAAAVRQIMKDAHDATLEAVGGGASSA